MKLAVSADSASGLPLHLMSGTSRHGRPRAARRGGAACLGRARSRTRRGGRRTSRNPVVRGVRRGRDVVWRDPRHRFSRDFPRRGRQRRWRTRNRCRTAAAAAGAVSGGLCGGADGSGRDCRSTPRGYTQSVAGDVCRARPRSVHHRLLHQRASKGTSPRVDRAGAKVRNLGCGGEPTTNRARVPAVGRSRSCPGFSGSGSGIGPR